MQKDKQNTFSIITDIIRMCRLYYGLPLAGGFLVIVYYLRGGDFGGFQTEAILAFTALLITISGGYVLNDYFDIETDMVNCPDRPLPSGRLTPGTARILSILLFTGGGLLAAIAGWKFICGIAAITATLIYYDRNSKQLGISKNIIIAALLAGLYPLAFLLSAAAETERLKVLYVHPFWLFMATLSYQMFKDIRDTEGDSITGSADRQVSRKRFFLPLAKGFILLAGVVSLAPTAMGACRVIYTITAAIALLLSIVAAISKTETAIRCIYSEIFLVTVGSLVDMLVYG